MGKQENSRRLYETGYLYFKDYIRILIPVTAKEYQVKRKRNTNHHHKEVQYQCKPKQYQYKTNQARLKSIKTNQIYLTKFLYKDTLLLAALMSSLSGYYGIFSAYPYMEAVFEEN
ncbi:Hypothetical predicted protein [Octopus vulgaris]|uniref:Uncharacterized protein n=1 Tax=Octopus vulgaris TaxID=6645 RepID=A0AA36AZM6_OCTVU|nr:Hypothetical predicted protein [Octopus vulgaris]